MNSPRLILVWALCAVWCPLPFTLPAAEEDWTSETEVARPAPKPPAAYRKLDRCERARLQLDKVDFAALRLAVQDLATHFPTKYTRGEEFLRLADRFEKRAPAVKEALQRKDESAIAAAAEIVGFQRDALLANPLLDFDRLLLIKRKPIGDPRLAEDPDRGIGKYVGMPQQSSWQLHTIPNIFGWENEIAVLSPVRPDGNITRLYAPPTPRLISDLDLHFDADRILFSMPLTNRLWELFEVAATGGDARQVSPEVPGVHNLDGCYLPNSRIAFISTAPFQGVPCNAGVIVGMSYLMDADGRNVRQLTFEQDHNFCPTVMNDGRILYLRWEYTDIPHVWARFLFTMNPDGTCQREYFGSGSYWPNAIFYARPIPNHPTKVVGIVTGHHVGRTGDLVIFDPARGRYSTNGVVQRIPGRGRPVEPAVEDKLTMNHWPKFLHVWPLSEEYFLAACKPSPDDLWGIYLVDVFDNLVLVKEVEDYALLEPIPFRKSPTPPVIEDRVDLRRKDALVYIEDIYAGPGLQDVPRGAVKNLRLFTYHFAYHGVAGINHRVGADGPWEPKRVLGTVPVAQDGSAFFRIPANTPISLQPLDAEGKALQLMRSWMTAMPGEIVSCTGCHEKQNAAAINTKRIATKRRPVEIEPWPDPLRGFSFARDVQPALDKFCVSCHDGAQGHPKPDLRADQGRFYCYKNGDPVGRLISGVPRSELVAGFGGVFDPAYIELRRLVRVGGLESDLRLLPPCEFHTDTTELFQMLEKGHHGVQLDDDAWRRLITWIDLNAPCHGTWQEIVGADRTSHDRGRRNELRAAYAGINEDPEALPEMAPERITPVAPRAVAARPVESVTAPGWPFDAAEAKRRQSVLGRAGRRLDLGGGVKLDLVLVPAGEFVMGDTNGFDDERPLTRVKIERPFWLGRFEVSNEQYGRFNPAHDSRFEHMSSWIFSGEGLGWLLNHPMQPVLRVSCQEAIEFCAWLAAKTGERVTLPTEAQWEYACRAGTATSLWYGDLDTDFGYVANMADINMRRFVYDARDQYSPDLLPRDARFNDRHLVTADIGSYDANPWGLHDMHGNVWEWTRSSYRPYPYADGDGRNSLDDAGRRVVRGGSWFDRPQRCRSAFRLSYPPWQKVYNVGFRVAVETDGKGQFARTTGGGE